MAERTDKDYAIEHAGYLAAAARNFLDALNAEFDAREAHDALGTDTTSQALAEAEANVSEARSTLYNRIYGFETRRDRALRTDGVGLPDGAQQ